MGNKENLTAVDSHRDLLLPATQIRAVLLPLVVTSQGSCGAIRHHAYLLPRKSCPQHSVLDQWPGRPAAAREPYIADVVAVHRRTPSDAPRHRPRASPFMIRSVAPAAGAGPPRPEPARPLCYGSPWAHPQPGKLATTCLPARPMQLWRRNRRSGRRLRGECEDAGCQIRALWPGHLPTPRPASGKENGVGRSPDPHSVDQ